MKTSKDPIESLFERLENQWDTEYPNLGHTDRFLKKLNKEPIQKRKNNSTNRFIKDNKKPFLYFSIY